MKYLRITTWTPNNVKPHVPTQVFRARRRSRGQTRFEASLDCEWDSREAIISFDETLKLNEWLNRYLNCLSKGVLTFKHLHIEPITKQHQYDLVRIVFGHGKYRLKAELTYKQSATLQRWLDKRINDYYREEREADENS